jgi:tetratricopeptide (TPR) repeat protein
VSKLLASHVPARLAVAVAVMSFIATASAAGAQGHEGHASASSPGASPLWGEMVPGPHAVGFKVVKLRDATRTWFRPTGGSASAGLPLVIRYWYPAQAGAAAASMTFGAYLAADAVDDQLRDPSPERLAESRAGLKAFFERPQNFTFGAVEPDRWAKLQDATLRAVANAPALPERFPLVVGVGSSLGNAALAEYLASRGYVVAVVGSPAATEMGQVARMEWYVRDVEFALAHLRALPNVDGDRVATWGFSFAGMPALLTAMRNPDVDAVVSLESAIFYRQYMPQLRGNPFHDPTQLRVPFFHAMRASESRANEQLAAIDSLRYARRFRYLVNDTAIVHQDFGTHGIAAAVVLEKRPGARDAVVKTQAANAEYVVHFLDAFVKGDRNAEAWLARSPEANRVAGNLVSVVRGAAAVPAPTAREFVAMIQRDGIAQALAKFHAARQADPDAVLFREATINSTAYEMLRSTRPADALALFRLNVELYPRSANAHDSLAEAYETTGDTAQALATARKALELLPGDATLTDAAKDGLRTVNEQRVRRVGGAS